ncbi:amino acid transporter (plasmid) [Deinococcus aetherius]|uniref:Amino acid transporter n=1 Tax=Deinococcus aetherius TaxID=200252 RepID=A0ABN6RRF6_9DEIO|nr:LysE/ArgO family amino acid transporter [Deinococcus aetherius]BDP44498.1 amino acid transporter [Deinococcus aetherius]
MNAALEGLLVGFSLIVAIGAQNAFVLRAGLRRQHPLTVALVSTLGDVLLITLGALGLGSLIAASDLLRTLATWGGAAFLFWFGFRSLHSARQGGHLDLSSSSVPTSIRSAALTALGFSLLNPHVYLDTVVLLGTVASRHVGTERAAFTLGASLASAAWFFALAYGAGRLVPLFQHPLAWRVLDVLIAAVVWTLAVRLLLGH